MDTKIELLKTEHPLFFTVVFIAVANPYYLVDELANTNQNFLTMNTKNNYLNQTVSY